MKKPTFFKIGFIVTILLLSLQSFAQNYVPFTPRFDQTLKGDIRLIGNNLLSEHASNPYSGSTSNASVNMIYVDIDGDSTTFNSSSAELEVPNIDCYQIVHAGLYWGAVNAGSTPKTQVKFKGPTGGYNDITGTIIYDANGTVTGNSLPYACYADVTAIVSGLGNNLGYYTVANVSTEQGRTQNYGNGTGQSAGWSLFVVYEDPSLPGKYITSFDGFSSVNAANDVTVPITGFTTPPGPIPVRANFAFAALEGDQQISRDRLLINGSYMSTADRGWNNFFNSKVTDLNGLVNNRIPDSYNTLGFDTGIMPVPNATSLIGNSANSANITMESRQDQYFAYFFAFAVDVIEPKIVLTKVVQDDAGNDIGNQTVGLSTSLNYVIGFENVGNDDANNLVIRDILPINVNFDYPADLGTLPPGVTHTYDPTIRELIFNIDNSVVEQEDPISEIRIHVSVVENCNELSDMCSNIIQNQAFATYSGIQNPSFEISDDPSVNTNTGCLLIPQATNFLADVDGCIFRESVILCGNTVELTAADDYDGYTWSSSPTGTPVIGTGQTITVSEVGTYYVHNDARAPCQSIDQIFEVTNFNDAILVNPVIAAGEGADQVVTCPNNGKDLPNIFLCGANDSHFIDTNITDADSIIWEQLDEGSCDPVGNINCANENVSCTWSEVGQGRSFNANSAGEFRITINYDGCFSQFYFNVYQNILNPTVTSNDIICTTPGQITVGGVPNGYEYSIDNVNFQSSNSFEIVTGGTYTVYVRQDVVDLNPCVFTVPDVTIRDRNFTVSTTVNQPLCFGDKGSIRLAANDVRPQYFFTLYDDAGTEVNSVGPITENNYLFPNLNPGDYSGLVTTEDGCTETVNISIVEPDLLVATSALTTPLTCEDGEITVYPVGGTPPYIYFVNGDPQFQTPAEIDVTTPGVYDIVVQDFNNCRATTTITVEALPQPVFTVDHTDILCYGYNSGSIEFDVTNANGYTITYSIDGGVSYSANSTFSNLTEGTYATRIKYEINGVECFTDSVDVIISQPDTALTASAGVSELAGCGPSGEGMVRITNPQGGTPLYEYSFDNQNTWVTTNEAYVTPGTYTLYIRDSNGCIFAMPEIILDPEPVAPTITVNEPDYNCDGSANATVTVTNPGTSNFDYTYYLDGVENTNTADPTTFINVPDGPHTITVEYGLNSVPTFSNLLYETFGYGEDTTSPGINTTYYCFERQVAATQCNGAPNINDGDYSVTSQVMHPFGTWLQPGDHTPNPTNIPKGRSLVVNIGDKIPVTASLYEKEINDIIPNQPINVEFFAINLLRTGRSGANPDLTVALVDAGGNEISSFSTGEIPKTENWIQFPLTPMTLDPGANSSLKFIVRSNVQQVDGNDVAIDDIKVFQLPKVCVTEVEFPFVVATGNAFSAQVLNTANVTCAGEEDGTITISAQNYDPAIGYQYSIDNGVTWNTQMTSPYIITGLGAQTYNVLVSYDGGATAGCSVPFTQLIEAPSVLEVTATATPVTCLVGSTVTATATGGSPAFTYELLDAASVLINTFPSNGILTNVPEGNYIVRATDINGCSDTFPLEILAPLTPTASIATTSDYCYDATNGATIEVTAADGLAPYEYNINGGAFTTNNTFAGLTPGSYDIIVRDANGCTVILATETIEDQLTINTSITKELDCTVSPDGEITGTISGGYAPYTYEVSYNGGAFTDLGTVTSPFTHIANADGTYQFQITDDRGCTSLSDVITINPIVNPTATETVVNVLCFGDATGSVQIIPSGGVGPYTYSFDGSAFTATSLYTGLVAGTYNYQVQDAKDCIFDGSVTITEPTALVVSASATTFTCSATNTPQVAVVTIDTPTTGTAPYTYSFNGSAYTATNTLNVNDNGTDQTINYSVQDANGCTAGDSIIILQLNGPTDLTFSATAVTCLVTDSEVTLTATDGVGVLTYEIISPAAATGNITGATSGIFTGLTPDTYVFTVTDENGCYHTESLTIDPVINITVSAVKLSDVLCFGDSTGAIQFNVTNTTGFTYTINGGAVTTGTSPIDLTGLDNDTYIIEVTDTATGCTATETITITEPTDALALTATATNVHCNDYNSQISVSATDGTPNYNYAAVLSGATAPVVADYASANPIVVNTNSGADLVWDVYVLDANGCTEMTTVTIVAEAAPTVSVPSIPTNQCSVASGFTFTATGTGTAPLQYSINGGASYQNNGTFTVNTPGTYTVTIMDANGCTAVSPTDIEVFAPLSVSALLTKDITCSLPEAASIDITVSGGNAAYTYQVSDDGGTTYTPIAGSPFTTTVAGTYQFLITDANGCTQTTAPVTVNPATIPDITAVTVSQDINCNGEETGALDITINTTLGLAPFVINVNNDTTGTNYGTQTSGLAAGDYTITVTDAKGCEDTETITIIEPDPIVLDFNVDPITCSSTGVSLGRIIINSVIGGTPNYTYHVTGANGYDEEILNQTGTTQVFEVVDFGLYEIIITDANGCTLIEQNIMVASPPDDLDIDISPTVDCATGGSADVTIGAASTMTGVGPFYFAIYTGSGMTWDGIPGGSAIWQLGAGTPISTTFTGLIPGVTYTFIVYDDDTKCYYYETALLPIPTNSTLTTSAVTENNITCTGAADGNVSFTINSVYGTDVDVSYEVIDAFTLAPIVGTNGTAVIPANGTFDVVNLGPLPFGNYVVVITETSGPNAGCGAVTIPFNITESAIELGITLSTPTNENCNELGSVSATATDGTSPYQYQVVTSGNAPVLANWGNPNTFDLAAGTYDVYVKDAYGCEKFDTVTIIRDADPTIDPVPQVCFDGTPFNITLSGTTFDPSGVTYSMGGAFQADPTFTITAAGTYTLSIQDANGCIATDTLLVEPPVLLDAVLDVDLTCTADATITLTPSGGTGTYNTYEVSTDGGTTYTVLAGPTYTATIDGTYIFQVTDSQGCTAISSGVVVTPNTAPTLTEIHTNVSCNGGSDGSITVTPANGLVPYQYSIDGGTTFQTSNLFEGLAAGTYTIIVRDGKNCDGTLPVTITEPTLVTGTGDLTQGLTCGAGNATQPAIITITGSGGTAPYTYSFDGINYTTTNTYSTTVDGTVTAHVKDANGCIIGTPINVIVPALSIPTDLDFTATTVTCINTESDVTLTTTNGVGPLTYEIIAPATATGNITGLTTGIFTGLAPDTYVFTVSDANGCYYTEDYTVIPVTNITVSGFVVDNVSCFGVSDGEVTFEVANFSNLFTYEFNGGIAVTGQTNTTITEAGLPAGTYTIVITDETTGCTATSTVEVTQPTAVSLVETININANCNFGAQVTVEASGGTAPYQYAFVLDGSAPLAAGYSSSASAVLDPATSTDWDVWVMDSQGCTAQIDVVIDTDPLPTATVPAFAINQCTVTTGFEFTVTNPTGIAPFSYSIGNGFQASPTFTVASAGTYTVTIKDGNGCTNAVPITFEIYPALDQTPNVTALASCADDDGIITVSATGGSGTYTYSINPNAGITLTGNVFSGVPSGTYTITVEDTVTGCTNDASVTLEAPTPVDFTLTPTDATCFGGYDGLITVDLIPGNDDNPIYTYEIIAGPSTAPVQNSNVFTGLEEGTYTVQVNSGRNCFATQTITVGEPNQIVVTVDSVVEYGCTAGTNATNYATITIDPVTGGSGTYTVYEFINAAGVPVQSGTNNVYTETDLAGGTYDINVYDDNGCVGSTSATILPFVSIDDLTVTVDTGITCTNNQDITVTVSSTGGTPDLEFELEDSTGSIQTNTTGVFTGLPVENYIITVTNLNTGCSLQTVHYINEPNTFDLTVDSVVDVTCSDALDGSVNMTFIDRSPNPTDESGPFSYDVLDALGNVVATGTTPNAGPIAVTGLASGTYTINATLVNTPFCTITKNFTITGPPNILGVTATHTEITCVSGNNDGTISASASGGWPGGYEYQLELTSGAIITPFSPVFEFTGLVAGDYIVSVRDSSGCIATTTVSLAIPDPINAVVSADITTLLCFGDTNATITVSNVTGGQGSNYTYTLINVLTPTNTESGPTTNPVFTGLGAGTYEVLIKDGYNCSFTTAQIVIFEPTAIEADLVKVTSQTCLTEATLELTASGGTGPYTYSDDPNFTTVFGPFTTTTGPFAVPVGTYQYYVEDANGCISVISNQITIDPLPALEIDIDVINGFVCTGETTGAVNAVAQGGLGNYTYTLQDSAGNNIIPAPTQTNPGVFSNLAAGTYLVYVESGVDCAETSAPFEIDEPDTPLTAPYTFTNVSCFGGRDGSIVVAATGGSGDIRYAISPQSNQFFDSGEFNGLAAGTYIVTVDDGLCFINLTHTITEPDPVFITVDPLSILDEICSGDLNGEFQVDITGGTAPYSVSLDDYNGPYTTLAPGVTDYTFTGLAGGDHIVFVRDANGCEYELDVTDMEDSINIDPTVEVEYGCVNNAQGNVVTVLVDDSTDPSQLDYSLNGAPYQASNVFIDVLSGNDHYIDVRHTNGCIQRTPLFNVEHFDPLTLVISDGVINEIIATATGGSGDYIYTLNGVDYGSTSTFIISESGTYTVTVTDSNGCVAIASRYFDFIDVCIPNYFTPNGDGVLDGWGPGCAIHFPNLEFDIFDRYGRKIATLGLGEKWYGLYKGKELPTGDYWYVVRLNDPKEDRDFVGHFTLYR
ncbi:T9SS type B sorting domain-containing protein [Bizionia argentinensis JUB59]|uniref:T9SS type B sorting domain-containing protein n=1 Tax=Bizionia argentinensis JUB59 TaxID=1046627 RepID=G2EHN0_9FLAO|nr:T9SS type B sorting domain-containing protein [Bizionia argentinensis]EGV42056.1 T9SS type B sorting domain-containing protein [Bizionia argentinensis JUB59]